MISDRSCAVVVKVAILCVGLIAQCAAVPADESAVDVARLSISADDLKRHVSFLASDSLEGRKAGTDGGHAAAAYIANHFRSLSLSPETDGYRQEFGDKGMRNVIARWGSPDSAAAPIIVSAHYDHVGKTGKGIRKENNGQIHNGADDNASGTALVLELAEACTQLPAPPRPVLFALWDGEEQGLVGSKHDADARAERGDLPSLAIVCDMVGRSSCRIVHCYGSQTADGLVNAIASAATRQPAETSPVVNLIDEHLPRSDHWPFYQKGVPYVLFHTGLHGAYHRPHDDADTLNYDSAAAIARLAFDVMVDAANGRTDLTFNDASTELPKTRVPPSSACPTAPEEKEETQAGVEPARLVPIPAASTSTTVVIAPDGEVASETANEFSSAPEASQSTSP